MNKNDIYKAIKIRRRPYYTWILRILWIVWLLFWLDLVVGSHQEWEPRAFQISLAVIVISFFLGLILWIRGIQRARKNGS